MKNPTIRVGVIGAGGNTKKFHIPGLQAQPGVEIVAVANRSLGSARKVAKAFNIPTACETWEDIIYDDEIDAVCIGTWPYMHAPLVIAALESEKHVLCEARMAMNAAEAHTMAEVARTHPALTAQIVPAPLTFKVDNVIADMVGEGYIGNLISADVRVALGSDFPQWTSPVHWRHLREFSGNNIMTMGIFYESIMRWLGTAKSVQALGANVVAHRRGDDGRRVAMTIPDHIDMLCEMEQGGQLRLNVTSVSGHLPSLDVNICGTEGTLRIIDEDGEIKLYAGNRAARKLKEIKIPKNKQSVWRVEEEFINAVRGTEEVKFTDFTTAIQYMEWTDAVSASLRTGEKVHLPIDAVA